MTKEQKRKELQRHLAAVLVSERDNNFVSSIKLRDKALML